MPGVLLHGSGSWAAGRKRAGERLLLAEGVGLGLVLVGGVTLAATGASRYVVGPTALVTIAGGGLFLLSFVADVYGATAPTGERAKALAWAPQLESELGWRYVHDPQFAYRNFMYQGFDLRSGLWRVSPSAWFALDDENARLRAETAYRLQGPRPDRLGPADGSHADVLTAVTHHAYDSDGFSSLTLEVAVDSRLDLQHFDSELRGSFVEGLAGVGLQRFSYEVQGLEDTDLESLLLARFGFGAYLPGPAAGGEVQVYYDHRKDDYAAALQLIGGGGGVVGHFGAEGRVYLDDQWGLRLFGEVGSAWIAGASLVYRHGRWPGSAVSTMETQP